MALFDVGHKSISVRYGQSRATVSAGSVGVTVACGAVADFPLFFDFRLVELEVIVDWTRRTAYD